MDLIFRQVNIKDGSPRVDVAIKNGKIAEIAPSISAPAKQEVQGNGNVLLPGFVESHLHLEKAFIMNRKANRSGTLKEAIAVTAALKPTFTREDILERSTQVLRALVQAGSTHVRAHAEFDPSQGFTGFDVVLELRDKFKDIIDIQVVAFPQEGILKLDGMKEMMVEAMKKGADVVGGIPYNDLPANEHIDYVFKLAKEFDKDLDFHQDFADNADNMTIEYLAHKTIQEGYQGRVSVGHLTSLAAVDPTKRDEIIELIRSAGISVMCLPATDLHMGARNDTHNVRRAVTPLRALRDGGVNVCLATNNIRNAFTPYGSGDLLDIAQLALPACHLGGADDQSTVISMLTTNPARALGLKSYGLEVGKDADLVLLDTQTVADVILDRPTRLMVLKRGNVVATATCHKSVFF
ncbi:amidohydrolase family protein [Citrobacter farmeri]|uniref:N-acyl-D-amino acid deacylase n=1 Tax=Citrobacter amalonaticus Y19 TaxID=1261127 RepID=A0A0F6RIH2_CITAM|nr:amidohydrolase family protein [Citrobacter amalonaticus]AKE61778.1 N-acyl-D-amino acid deacylase [Citrobacter amalonaticus Y19]EKV5656226.1 amidohydrolase family protein [Citrobacter farmeri]